MKVLFIKDQHASGKDKELIDSIVDVFSRKCEFNCLTYDDELKKIVRTSPDLIFHLHSIRSDLHVHLMKRGIDKKFKTACWILNDTESGAETAYIGAYYKLVFSDNKEGVDDRNYYGYSNVHLLDKNLTLVRCFEEIERIYGKSFN